MRPEGVSEGVSEAIALCNSFATLCQQLGWRLDAQNLYMEEQRPRSRFGVDARSHPPLRRTLRRCDSNALSGAADGHTMYARDQSWFYTSSEVRGCAIRSSESSSTEGNRLRNCHHQNCFGNERRRCSWQAARRNRLTSCAARAHGLRSYIIGCYGGDSIAPALQRCGNYSGWSERVLNGGKRSTDRWLVVASDGGVTSAPKSIISVQGS